MKLKYYLRGLGTGILFATLVLFISYTYHNTDAQIKKRAKELGMVEAVETTTPFFDETSGDGASSAAETTTTTEETTAADTTTTANDETTTSYNSVTVCEFTILSGMDSSQVSELIMHAGLVEDAQDFDKYLVQNGYAERIRVGTFKINAGSSYLDIALLITN